MLTPGHGEEMISARGTAGRLATYGTFSFMATEQAEKTITSMSKGLMRNTAFADFVAEKLGRSAGMAATQEGAAMLSKELLEKGFFETLGKKGAARAMFSTGARGGLSVAAQGLRIGTSWNKRGSCP
jgi:hypothetical protein